MSDRRTVKRGAKMRRKKQSKRRSKQSPHNGGLKLHRPNRMVRVKSEQWQVMTRWMKTKTKKRLHLAHKNGKPVADENMSSVYPNTD